MILVDANVLPNARVFERPLTVEQSVAYIEEWLSQPVATTVGPGKSHWRILSNLLTASGTGGI